MSEQALPPSWQHVGRHAVFPQSAHDDTARFDFLANLNGYLSTRLSPKVRESYEKRVKPAFEQREGRAPESRHEVRKAMAADPVYQTWSALRRNTMEMRQQAGRGMVLRQLGPLIDKVRQINETSPGLQLDPSVQVPRYVSAVDIHCMPGGYHTELVPGDVLAPANYDSGIFATTGGMLGRWNDGGGQALAQWLKKEHPQFKPRRILDLGCTVGQNAVPLAQAFPEAEVIAIDVAAPMLRYAHARAVALGKAVHWHQRDIRDTRFPDAHFDLVTSSILFHEVHPDEIGAVFREAWRVLAPGGVMAHIDIPNYFAYPDPLFVSLVHADTFHNNEPFWGEMHRRDLVQLMVDAGFEHRDCFRGIAAMGSFPWSWFGAAKA